MTFTDTGRGNSVIGVRRLTWQNQADPNDDAAKKPGRQQGARLEQRDQNRHEYGDDRQTAPASGPDALVDDPAKNPAMRASFAV